MDKNRLWAKSCPRGVEPRDSMYLAGHLRDVLAAADGVLDATVTHQIKALGLDSFHGPRLSRCVRLAAAVHDLGKANSHFQGMLLGDRDPREQPQGVRHEWVTVLMMQELRAWLLPAVGGSELDLAFVEWAVAGHHPAHNHESPPRACPSGGSGAQIAFLVDHPDFVHALGWLKGAFALHDEVPRLPRMTKSLVGGGSVFTQLARWERAAARLWDSTPRLDRRLLAAVKNSLIAADVAGSALPKHGPADFSRVGTALRAIPSAEDLEFLAGYGLDGQAPRLFQIAVAKQPDDVVLVKAGCGTGKTIAAYLRAAKQWAGRRLYFCYPTTGTATEGYKDYLHPEFSESPADDSPARVAERERLRQVNADLFHSRSAVDFEIILSNGKDDSSDAETVLRADALEAWATPVVACTVDAVLGLVQNNRRGLFAWPALANSAFVFDEVHAYDDRLFAALMRFLSDLPGLPALLMTASLPAARESVLADVLSQYRGGRLHSIEGPRELEELPRYHKLSGRDVDLLKLIANEVECGGKVLWVSNTVKRVIASADAATAAGLKPLIYHSRFKYVDRVRRHRDVIEAFTPKVTSGAVACTSQVCEMSLDLKGCTLLVTEFAPVPALIQRLGRLNRHAKPPEKEGEALPPTMPFCVLKPDNHLPYAASELAAAERWLEKLPAVGISQRALVTAWEQDEEVRPGLAASAWLDGGPRTTVSELREASPGITVVLEGDLSFIRTTKDLGKFTLPMPSPPRSVDWRSRKYRGVPVVANDTVDYCPKRGAEWRV